MLISAASETRAYPELRPSCPTENELEFMASLFRRASPVDKSYPIEPNSNGSRKVSEYWILITLVPFGLNGVIV